MSDSFEKKCEEIKKKFAPLSTEQKYQELMAMGRELPPFSQTLKTSDRLVSGCQSTLYLCVHLENGKCFFEADSDALISKGLAALLIFVYSGEPPETILKCPPHFIGEIGIGASLSPNRSNGLAQIHLKMQKEALKILLNGSKV